MSYRMDDLPSFFLSFPRRRGLAWQLGISLPVGLLATTLMVLTAGCQDSGPVLVPVSGELHVSGEPAAGARVILNPGGGFRADDWPGGKPNAIVADDGKFVVRTPMVGDGVPPGDYKLTFVWLVPAPGSDPSDPEPETIDQLQGRYVKPENSEITIDVQPPETTIDRIDLE
jgi:hypothetical protein